MQWAAGVEGLGWGAAALSFDLCGGRSGGITRVVQEVAWRQRSLRNGLWVVGCDFNIWPTGLGDTPSK